MCSEAPLRLNQKGAARQHQRSVPAATQSCSPSSTPKERKNSWTLPNAFTSASAPSQTGEKDGKRKKKAERRGGRVQCVLKMAGLPLAARRRAHVLRTGGCVEIKDGRSAPHQQTRLLPTPKRFSTSARLASSARSNSLLGK